MTSKRRRYIAQEFVGHGEELSERMWCQYNRYSRTLLPPIVIGRSLLYVAFVGNDDQMTAYYFPWVTSTGTATAIGTSTTTVTLVSPLLAASNPSQVVTDKLSAAQLSMTVKAAIERWSRQGLTIQQISPLQSTTYVVANIGLARELGQASSGKAITIDDNAAGFGWFVDTTPRDDQEFTKAISKSEFVAPGMTRMDLLTVVMHEMGHILGLPDIDDDKSTGVMTDAIAAGTRRVSTAADLHALVQFQLNCSGTRSGGSSFGTRLG
jgi:hypothetical protein